MDTLILTLHVIACIVLVILVLLQAGKEGMGVIFGGGSQTVFGSGGAGNMIAKLTGIVAVVFLFTSLSYNYMTGHRSTSDSSILDVQIEEKAEKPLLLEDAAPKAVQTEDGQPAANN